jgi:hypothetical protein
MEVERQPKMGDADFTDLSLDVTFVAMVHIIKVYPN